jgi:hypothetical protein
MSYPLASRYQLTPARQQIASWRAGTTWSQLGKELFLGEPAEAACQCRPPVKPHVGAVWLGFLSTPFSKIFNSAWKNLKKIGGHSWTCQKNEKKKIKKNTARFFGYCGVRDLGVPKGVKALNFQFCPYFAEHCDPIFHLVKKISFTIISLTSQAILSNFFLIFPSTIKDFWKSAISKINFINHK